MHTMTKPKIAILMDENTSGDATRYEASKNYFRAVSEAGGLPFGVPYSADIIHTVVNEFDGLLTCGGRFAYPSDWYIGDQVALAPESDRFEIEKAIVLGCLARDRPILGICAGMQMLACLHGSLMTADLRVTFPEAQEHDEVGHLHDIEIDPASKISGIIGAPTLSVNSLHREAIAELGAGVVACAHTNDGIVEAVELPAYSYVVGLQWHQEKFAGTDHLGNRFFSGLIEAC